MVQNWFIFMGKNTQVGSKTENTSTKKKKGKVLSAETVDHSLRSAVSIWKVHDIE